MYVCMHVIFIRCDKRTSNNKHKKQSQNDVQYKAAKAFGVPVTPVEFRGDLSRQKTRLPELSCGVVCVILRLAGLVELRLVTDRQTDTDRHRPMASTADA